MKVWLRRAAWALAAVLLLFGLAWAGVPWLVKSQGEARLTRLLGRTVTFGRVEFRPWNLELSVHDIAVAGAAPGRPLLGIARLYADVQAASLWRRAPVLRALEIDAPVLRVARLAEGHYDIDDLIQRLAPRPDEPAGEPARFALNNVRLGGGAILLDDRVAGRQHELRGLALTLPFLSNLPSDVQVQVEPRLAFTLNGAAFDSGAHATPFARHRNATLELHVGDTTKGDLDLAPYLGYLPQALPWRLQAGRLGADLKLHFAVRDDGTPSLQIEGSTRAGDIAIADAHGAPLLAWRRLDVEWRDVRPLARQLHLGKVVLDGARLHLARDAQGRINLAALAPADPGKPPATAAAASSWRAGVDTLTLAAAAVQWDDATTAPAASLRLDALALTARNLHWPVDAPIPVTLGAELRASDGAPGAGRLEVEGQATDREAQLSLRLAGLALPALAPYVAQQLAPRLEGRLDAKARLAWVAGATPKLQLDLDEARVEGLRLIETAAAADRVADAAARAGQQRRRRAAEPAGEGAAFALQQLRIDDAAIDVLGRTLTIGRVSLQAPSLQLLRGRDGRWNVQGWSTPVAAAPPAATAAPAGPAWRVRLQALALDGGQLRFVDAAPGGAAQPLRLELDALKLALQGVDWPARAGAPASALELSANLAARGGSGAARPARLEWRGRLGLAPIAARGALRIERLPVHAFAAYLGDGLRIRLRHALASYRGDVGVESGARGLAAQASGEMRIADLSVSNRADAVLPTEEELLRWQSLALHELRFALRPGARPSLAIGRAELDDFYSRLVVTEQGRFNLQDVAAAVPAPVASVPAPAASAAAAAEPLPIELRVGGVQLRDGHIDFSDHFVRPNYSAALTELTGTLGAFDSETPALATLELHGRAAGTALLEVNGRINPTARPLALDIQAKASDLELAPLSPYAGKYAGYAIERGKLSMEVSYRIDADGRLEAKNQLLLNQLTFGDKIDSPSATKLPVLLAVALLKDRNGVIDINVPVSGSLNDPQFSVGGVIVKVVLNLLAKALTAPFSLFSGGGGADLSVVEFRPGTPLLAEGAAAALDKVAKALADRPALKMTVTGASDGAAERDSYRHAWLEQRLLAERRRELLREGSAPGAPITLGAEDRERLVRALYADTPLPDKPRNLLGLAKRLPLAEMETRLREHAPATPDALRELALQRGLAVRDALIARGVPSERLFLAAPRVDAAGAGGSWTPRAQLALSTR